MGRAGYPGGYYYRRLADDGHFNTLVGNVRPTAKQSRVIHPSVRIVSFSSGGPLYAELVVSNIASFLSASKLALKAFLTGFGLKARSNNKHNRLVSLFTAVQLLTEGRCSKRSPSPACRGNWQGHSRSYHSGLVPRRDHFQTTERTGCKIAAVIRTNTEGDINDRSGQWIDYSSTGDRRTETREIRTMRGYNTAMKQT